MDKAKLEKIESEIETQQRNIKYDTKEYIVEIVVKKYLDGLDENDNEFYVPDYQREFVWDEYRQSRFIESLVMGLPIPYIFLAEDSKGKSEIVDGSQRIRTLAAFLRDELTLKGLKKLPSLNGVKYSDLDKPKQRKINNMSLKMIALSEQTTDESKNDIFERINRGSDLLKDMESRKGIYRGNFNDFIYNLAKDARFAKLTPIAHWFENRQEREELLLRFFALIDMYPRYADNIGIARQLDTYFEKKNKEGNFSEEEKRQKQDTFNKVMLFIEKSTKYGFSKTGAHQVSRVYFEALSVGSYFALLKKPDLTVSQEKMDTLVNNRDFREITSGKYKTHTPQKIKARIDYITNGLVNA